MKLNNIDIRYFTFAIMRPYILFDFKNNLIFNTLVYLNILYTYVHAYVVYFS